MWGFKDIYMRKRLKFLEEKFLFEFLTFPNIFGIKHHKICFFFSIFESSWGNFSLSWKMAKKFISFSDAFYEKRREMLSISISGKNWAKNFPHHHFPTSFIKCVGKCLYSDRCFF